MGNEPGFKKNILYYSNYCSSTFSQENKLLAGAKNEKWAHWKACIPIKTYNVSKPQRSKGLTQLSECSSFQAIKSGSTDIDT